MQLRGQFARHLRADLIDSEKTLNQFSSLLDSCFEVPKGKRFLDDFPVWDARFEVASSLRIGIFHGDILVSSAAVRICSLKTPSDEFVKVASIGAVATDGKWRKM